MGEQQNERLTKQYERWTEYGHYIIIVTVDAAAKKKYVDLYRKENEVGKFWSWIGLDREFIGNKAVSWYGSIEKAINDLIVEHEIVDRQLDQLEEADPYIYIDLETELEKRRPKAKEQPRQEQHQELNNESQPIKVNDWVNGSTYVITSNGKAVNFNSLSNLPQYRHLKK